MFCSLFAFDRYTGYIPFFAWEQHVEFFGKKTFCCALMTVFHNMAAETKLHLNLDSCCCTVDCWKSTFDSFTQTVGT